MRLKKHIQKKEAINRQIWLQGYNYTWKASKSTPYCYGSF